MVRRPGRPAGRQGHPAPGRADRDPGLGGAHRRRRRGRRASPRWPPRAVIAWSRSRPRSATSTTWPATSVASTPPSTRRAPTVAWATPRSTSSCPQTPPTPDWLAAADAVAEAESHLKFRTGGLEAHLFPDAATVAAWIDAALDRETPYKCTAGLHHALRHRDHETGFEHHGFLNVLLATRRAFDGGTVAEVAEVLDDHYANDLVALARTSDLAGARRWFTSYGSCSVSEPLDDLLGPGLAGGDRMTDGDGFGLDHLPYGVYSVGARRPRVGVRLGDSVLDVADRCGPELAPADAERLHGPRPDRLGRDPRRDRRARRGRRARRRPRSPRSACTCRSRSATTSTSTRPSTTPPTSAGSSGPTRSRCCRTGATSRSATTAAAAPSSSAVRRSSGRAGSGLDRRRREGRQPHRVRSEPSPRHRGRAGLRDRRRLRARAAGSVSATSPTTSSASSASTTGRPATSRPGSTCRSARSSASRSRPRSSAWVTPLAALDAAWCDLPGQDPTPLDYLVSTGTGRRTARARPRRRGGAQRRGGEPAAVPHHVLVARPDAGPPHRQRRLDPAR